MVNDVDSIYRATMTDLTFRGLKGVHVDLFDLEQATFTRTHLLQERYAAAGDVWHVVGTDLIESGKSELSFIHQIWEDGKRLWQEYQFAVVTRSGSNLDPGGSASRSQIDSIECRRIQRNHPGKAVPPRVDQFSCNPGSRQIYRTVRSISRKNSKQSYELRFARSASADRSG